MDGGREGGREGVRELGQEGGRAVSRSWGVNKPINVIPFRLRGLHVLLMYSFKHVHTCILTSLWLVINLRAKRGNRVFLVPVS